MNNTLKICKGSINKISESLIENEINGKILYIADPFVDKLYGNTVKKQLSSVAIVEEEYSIENTISCAMDIAKRILANDITCLAALGGGKVLDLCKYASYISKIPMLSIPTTAANDGVVSPIAVLIGNSGKPKSLGARIPSMVHIDMNIIEKCPSHLIKAGIGDTVSNYMALKDWMLACDRHEDEMNGYAYLMSRNAFDMLFKSQYKDICPEFIEVLVNSIVLSGLAMGFAGSSRPVSGSEHLFSHALDYYSDKNNLHGIQVALGTIVMLKLIGENYQDVLNYLHNFGVDINPLRLGIDKETFVFCLKNATKMRSNRYTYLNEVDLENNKLNRLYNELLEELQ